MTPYYIFSMFTTLPWLCKVLTVNAVSNGYSVCPPPPLTKISWDAAFGFIFLFAQTAQWCIDL